MAAKVGPTIRAKRMEMGSREISTYFIEFY